MTCIYGGCSDMPSRCHLRKEGLSCWDCPLKRLSPTVSPLQKLPWLKKTGSPKAISPSSSSLQLVTCKGPDPHSAMKGHPRPRASHGVSWALRWDCIEAQWLPLPSLLLSLLFHGSLSQELSLPSCYSASESLPRDLYYFDAIQSTTDWIA